MREFFLSAAGRAGFDVSGPRGRRDARLRGRRALLASSLVLAALAGVALLSPGGSSAASLESIQGQIEKTRGKLEHARGRERVLTSDIAAISGRIRTLEREIGALRRREGRIEHTLAAKRAELAELQERYQREHARYLVLKRKLRRAQVVLGDRLVEIYKSDQPDLLTVVLESDGFADLLERADYLSRIGEQDAGIVERVHELERRSAEKRRLLLELKERAQAAVETIEEQQRALAASRGALQSRQGDLAGARRQKQGALGGVREHRHDLEGDLSALEAASAQVTEQLQSGSRLPAGPVRHGSGGFIWPVNGPVVSGFGMRWGRLHAGVDIAVPNGTPVRAAAGGRVAMAGVVGGYGNYVCIQHGGGIATCYAHLSGIGVGSGGSARQGQVIGSSGCTGHCFGPHLHFEVRVNGSPVDPMGYL
jgi:murein DD-endopeptidase MepM/ murein hydrolase activator NlpD